MNGDDVVVAAARTVTDKSGGAGAGMPAHLLSAFSAGGVAPYLGRGDCTRPPGRRVRRPHPGHPTLRYAARTSPQGIGYTSVLAADEATPWLWREWIENMQELEGEVALVTGGTAAEEIATLVTFSGSGDAGFITGANGGQQMHRTSSVAHSDPPCLFFPVAFNQ